MPQPHRTKLEFERRLLEHPAAYHLRRMRLALWLYLDLLTRLPAGQDTIEVAPLDVAMDMGLPEGVNTPKRRTPFLRPEPGLLRPVWRT